jgi:hypothetical protein
LEVNTVMSIHWNRDVLQQFDNLWPCLGPSLRSDMMSSSPDVIHRYKAMTFQALTVWARQYSYMLVKPKTETRANEMYYPVATRNAVTDAMYSEGIDPLKTVNCVRRVMQLHQEAAKNVPDAVANGSNGGMEAYSDRRERLARYSYLQKCAERVDEFKELVANNRSFGNATFEAVSERLRDGDGGAGEQTVVWMRVTGCKVIEDEVTLDSSKDEFMASVVCPTDEVIVSTRPEWRPVSNLLRTLHQLEQDKREREPQAARTFTDPTGAEQAKAMLKDIASDMKLYTSKLNEHYLRIGKWMVRDRLRNIAELGYAYVGTRDGNGDGWFMRTVSEMETLANALMGEADIASDMFGEVPNDPVELKRYEVSRATEMRTTFVQRSKKFLTPHELSTEGELSLATSELYHYEEALRCKVVDNANSTDILSREDEPRVPQHAPSLPKINSLSLEVLLSYPQKMNLLLTPRETHIPFDIMERVGLQQDRYDFGYSGVQLQSALVAKPEFNSEVAHEAMKRVMGVISYAVTNHRTSLQPIALGISRLLRLQTSMQKAMATANTFIQESSAFWKRMREDDDCSNMLETVAVDDVLVVVLSHIEDPDTYMTLVRTCTALNKSEALRGALPRLKTSIMTGGGHPGTIQSVDGIPKVRKDMLVSFHTTFGFYKPQVDACDQWVPMCLRKFAGANKETSVTVVLVYDAPGVPAIRSREAVLRMGMSSGNKATGKFTIDNMHTPIKILTTSSSVNPIQKSVYTDAVSHWEAVVSRECTMYARKRLEKARVECARNKKQQCVRVRIVLEHNGQVMTAISEPFMSVANLTKEKQKEKKAAAADGAKRQRT